MPELPEIETLRRGLQGMLHDRPVVESIEFLRADLRDPIPKKRLRAVVGQPIEKVLRRGKYLLFETPVGWMLSHLGMTGTWRARGVEGALVHDHVIVSFRNGLRLVYRDPRRFGVLDWVDDPEDHPRLNHLGVEPLGGDFHAEGLREIAKSRVAPIKNVLMDASVVVGVGNIYASEALHRAGVRPSRPANRVKLDELRRVVSSVREVLQESIAAGGSSISDYVQADGQSGRFQERFKVYDRDGDPCFACGTAIRRTVQAGRSTFFCSVCQK